MPTPVHPHALAFAFCGFCLKERCGERFRRSFGTEVDCLPGHYRQCNILLTRVPAMCPQTEQAARTSTPKTMNATTRRLGGQLAVSGLARMIAATIKLPAVVKAVGQVNACRTSLTVAAVGKPPS